MSSQGRRPLPAPPNNGAPMGPRPNQHTAPWQSDIYSVNNPYSLAYAYPPHAPPPPDLYEEQTTTSVPVGTFLHKGFYDLLAMIPTPSPSRLLWSAPSPPPENVVAGPRYEDMNANTGTRAMPKKGRRVSKDMVSKPMGFVFVLRLNSSSICFSPDQPSCSRVGRRPTGGSLDPLGSRWSWEAWRLAHHFIVAVSALENIYLQILIGQTRSRITLGRGIKQRQSTKLLTPFNHPQVVGSKGLHSASFTLSMA